jgi:hypothetical protein
MIIGVSLHKVLRIPHLADVIMLFPKVLTQTYIFIPEYTYCTRLI